MLRKNIGQKTMIFIRLLAELDEQERDILVNRFWYGYSLKKVAEKYGVTDSAIKVKEDELIDNINKTFDYYELFNNKTISRS